MRTSQRGIDLIKEFEGYRSEAYLDQVGVWTIGYGHTLDVKQGDQVNSEEAEALLRQDLMDAESAVYDLKVPLPQNKFDALVSLVFNVGPRAIGPLSSIGIALRGEDYERAGRAILLWNRAGGKLNKGLKRRREREKALWDGGIVEV